MSLILDALRKMEQERKARRQGETDIRPEVLSYRGAQTKPSGSSFSLPVATTIIMVLACIGGWLLFREGKSTPEPLAKEISTSKNITPQPAQTTPLPQPQVTIAPVTNQSAPAPAAIQQPTPPTQKKEAATPVNDVAAASGITISGIAYQDERYMRRAVINGALVGEGAEVAGAKVVEIKENRVKFSRGGESFEVVYSSSLTR